MSRSASQILNKNVMNNHLSSWEFICGERKTFEPPKTRNLHGNEFDLGKQFWLWKQDMQEKGERRETNSQTLSLRWTKWETKWEKPAMSGNEDFFPILQKGKHFALLHFLLKNLFHFASEICNWFRVKKSLHFASNVVIIFRVNVTFCGVTTITSAKKRTKLRVHVPSYFSHQNIIYILCWDM